MKESGLGRVGLKEFDLGLGNSICKGPVVGKHSHIQKPVWMEQVCKQESK